MRFVVKSGTLSLPSPAVGATDTIALPASAVVISVSAMTSRYIALDSQPDSKLSIGKLPPPADEN